MKVATLFICVVVVGVFGQAAEPTGPGPFECDGSAFTCGFKKLGHHVKYHANKLGENLKEVGAAILNSAIDHGTNLMTTAAKALLSTALEHLTKEEVVGKREVAFFDKVREHVANGKELMKEAKQALHAAFEKAVNKLTGMMCDMATLKSIESDADKKVDIIVEEFNREGKKGFAAMAQAVISKLQSIFQEGMAQFKIKFGKKIQERAIPGFNSFSEAWEKAKGHLSSVSGAIADTFKPHLDSLKDTIADLADQTKQHGSNLADAAVDSLNTLKDELNKQVDTLKGHAAKLGDQTNAAIDALKEAVSSIAAKTLNDITTNGGETRC